MRKQPIPASFKKVLLQIAREGPQTKYDIEKKTKVNHASVHDAIKHFIKTGVLEGEKVGITRTGQAKTKYKITFAGIWPIIEVIESKQYDEIFPKLKHFLPLLFGKWIYFRNHGLSEELVKALNWLNREVDYWRIDEIWTQNQLNLVPEELRFDFEGWVMDRFGDYVFMFQPLNAKTEWLKAFREDNELKQWAIKRIERLLNEGHQLMASYEENLRALKTE